MKYYAVKKGRNPGIYTSWDLCLKEVKGYKGAIYKSFKKKEDAEDFLEDKKIEIKPDKDSVIAYIDGSYSKKDKKYGVGIVYITDEKIEEIYKDFDDEFHIHRNVAGEVKASVGAINKAISEGKKTIYIHYDYQGIESWAKGDWKRNNELTKRYYKFFQKAKEKIDVHFIKVKAHSNDKYNDMADALAKKSLGIES